MHGLELDDPSKKSSSVPHTSLFGHVDLVLIFMQMLGSIWKASFCGKVPARAAPDSKLDTWPLLEGLTGPQQADADVVNIYPACISLLEEGAD